VLPNRNGQIDGQIKGQKMDTISGRIKHSRTAIGLKQKDLADALKVSINLVSKWELGQAHPRERHLQKLANVLQISKVFLMFGQEYFDDNELSLDQKIEQLTIPNQKLLKAFIELLIEQQEHKNNGSG
jgi:transcriptional regulator with XRE-family HTH domain